MSNRIKLALMRQTGIAGSLTPSDMLMLEPVKPESWVFVSHIVRVSEYLPGQLIQVWFSNGETFFVQMTLEYFDNLLCA